MRASPLLYAFALASYVVAGDIDANDLPSECKDVCASVVSLTSSCDKKTNNDDTAELDCICKDPRAAKSLPECDACITKYSKDGRDNDANDLVRSCSFTTTEYSATATSASGSPEKSIMTTTVSGSSTVMTMTGSKSATGSSTASNTAATTSNAALASFETSGSVMGALFVSLMALVGV
ncbi:hypothetical protein N7532_005650 [Penicillium argentinense]|uniref:GPI anchored protein n=1 Tax=Penicillium argentinense TaxID=1131581 RepID=A0A9W9FEF0_9EURO|nr:uncharacterized protein N7532_005650 [Penicillium argentinense]KAJ5098649.1 hypothetical protein N7532_005650 [Penicillium argentinense]